ncbi:MAG: hypothetical protein M0P11_00445 [Anaerolineaceae bacterium]|nr:hypothetical protein [Anaerolineaceae bacterium]
MKLGKPCRIAGQYFKLLLLFVTLAILVTSSAVCFDSSLSSLSNLTRWNEFNYISWVATALVDKIANASMGLEHFIDDEKQAEIVLIYLNQVGRVEALENQLEELNFRPDQTGTKEERLLVLTNLQAESKRMHRYGRVAESILQNQTERTLVELGFGLGGQVLPPLLFKVTDLPLNLILSPREQIGNLGSISLKPGLNALEKNRLEDEILVKFDLAALVEPVGGVGAYPTMVMRTRSINWLTEVIAHEWFHNYLSFYPLGIRYFSNDPIKTINETTANLAGKEVGRRVMNQYYPAYVNRFYLQGPDPATVLWEGREPAFNYRKQMRETRLAVDYLLSLGRVEQAEDYMKKRREYFWQNGYRIRKINQAYFAFYGSYNDTPGGGAAGDDPVGPAVQELRQMAAGLKSFIDEIKQIKSFEELLNRLK